MQSRSVPMPHRPTFDEFAAPAREHTVVPVYRQLTGDTLTPVSAFCKVQEGDWSFLFESVVGGERIGRYSFLGSGPFRSFEAYGHRVRTRDGSGKWMEREAADPLRVLEEMIAAYRVAEPRGAAALLRRGGRLRRLRHRPLRRAVAERPARRPQHSRPFLRLLRPHGHLRPRREDGSRRGQCPGGRWTRPSDGVYGCLPPRGSTGRTSSARRRGHSTDRHSPIRSLARFARRVQLHPSRVRGRRREGPRVHQCRRRLPDRPEPAVPDRDSRRVPSTSTAHCAS